AGKAVTATLNAATLGLVVDAAPARWTLVPSAAGDLVVRQKGEHVVLRLADAPSIAIAPYDTGFKTGVKIALSGWRHNGAPLDLSLYLTLALEGRDEELAFDVAAREGDTIVRQLDWPAPLDARDVDDTVLNAYRGTLLPRAWPAEYNPIRPDLTSKDTSEIQ